MKTNKFIFLALLVSGVAQAAPLQFKSCNSDIVTEVFTSCPGGEGNSSTPCGSVQTKWGSVQVDLAVDSQNKTAKASLTYTPVKGQVKKSTAVCTLGSDNWMECVTPKPITELGKLNVSFNIDGIAPDVYFVDIFADATNVPVGEFQTALNCQK